MVAFIGPILSALVFNEGAGVLGKGRKDYWDKATSRYDNLKANLQAADGAQFKEAYKNGDYKGLFKMAMNSIDRGKDHTKKDSVELDGPDGQKLTTEHGGAQGTADDVKAVEEQVTKKKQAEAEAEVARKNQSIAELEGTIKAKNDAKLHFDKHGNATIEFAADDARIKEIFNDPANSKIKTSLNHQTKTVSVSADGLTNNQLHSLLGPEAANHATQRLAAMHDVPHANIDGKNYIKLPLNNDGTKHIAQQFDGVKVNLHGKDAGVYVPVDGVSANKLGQIMSANPHKLQVATPEVTAKGSTPKVDAPKVETPKVESQTADAPKVDAPKADAPTVESKAKASVDNSTTRMKPGSQDRFLEAVGGSHREVHVNKVEAAGLKLGKAEVKAGYWLSVGGAAMCAMRGDWQGAKDNIGAMKDQFLTSFAINKGSGMLAKGVAKVAGPEVAEGLLKGGFKMWGKKLPFGIGAVVGLGLGIKSCISHCAQGNVGKGITNLIADTGEGIIAAVPGIGTLASEGIREAFTLSMGAVGKMTGTDIMPEHCAAVSLGMGALSLGQEAIHPSTNAMGYEGGIRRSQLALNEKIEAHSITAPPNVGLNKPRVVRVVH